MIIAFPEQTTSPSGAVRFVIDLPYATPPLTANQRFHWQKKAEITKGVRAFAAYKCINLPFLDKCDVELTWYVNDKRRRDADNVVPTLKALCDGIVDADVVRDDVPAYMTKHMPVIVYRPGKPAGMELVITAGSVAA